MDQTTAWLIAFFIVVVAFGVTLRRRYGNVYLRFSEAVERATGFQMVRIVRAIGIVTLAAWALVYVISGPEPDTGLEDLFGWQAGRSDGAADRP